MAPRLGQPTSLGAAKAVTVRWAPQRAHQAIRMLGAWNGPVPGRVYVITDTWFISALRYR